MRAAPPCTTWAVAVRCDSKTPKTSPPRSTGSATDTFGKFKRCPLSPLCPYSHAAPSSTRSFSPLHSKPMYQHHVAIQVVAEQSTTPSAAQHSQAEVDPEQDHRQVSSARTCRLRLRRSLHFWRCRAQRAPPRFPLHSVAHHGEPCDRWADRHSP